MFGNAIKASKQYDRLVAENPERLDIRMLRAVHSYRLPETFFHRTAAAVSDLEYLEKKFNENNEIFPKKLYFKLLYILSNAYGRIGMEDEAEAALNRLLEGCDDERLRELAMSRLFLPEPLSPVMQDEKVNEKPNERELFKQAKQLFELAQEGDRKAASASLEIFSGLYEKHPEVPVIEAFYGSAAALNAKFSEDSQAIFGGAGKGIKLLNHAVESEPDNARLRFLRGSLFIELPEAFFHLGERGCEDLRLYMAAYEKDNSILSRHSYCRMLYSFGKYCRKTGKRDEAFKILNRLVELEPGQEILESVMRMLGRGENE